MGYISCVTLPFVVHCLIVHCLTSDAISSLEVNSSYSFSLGPADSTDHAIKNNFVGLPRTNTPHPASHFSHDKVSLFKILSIDPKSETFEGFEFVDSPDPPDDPKDKVYENDKKIGEITGHGSRVVNGDGVINKNSWITVFDRAVNRNVWKTYPNGTIIHDVRISLVHPASMGNYGGSGQVEPNIVSPNQTTDTVSSSPGMLRTLRRASGQPESETASGLFLHMTSAMTGNSSASFLAYSMNGSTTIDPLTRADDVHSIAFVGSESDKSTSNSSGGVGPSNSKPISRSTIDIGTEATGQNGTIDVSYNESRNEGAETKDKKSPPGKIMDLPIDAKALCLGDCITKCYKGGSSVHQASKLSLCLPLIGFTTEGNLMLNVSDRSSETMPSTASVLVGRQQIAGESDDLPKIVNSDVAPVIEYRMLKAKDSPEPKLGFLLEDVCLSEKCILKAADILRRMDSSVNPCDSFYKFVCGGFSKNEIPDGESSRSVFSDIATNIIARMYSILKSPINATDPPAVNLLKRFYAKCVLTSQKELFVNALEEIGGWPSPSNHSQRVPQHTWGEIAFNLTYGMFLEYNLVSINFTFVTEMGKWILNVDYPHFVKVALDSGTLAILDEIERDIMRVADVLGIDDIKSGLADLRIFMASAVKYANATMSASNSKEGLYTLKSLTGMFTHLDVLKRLPSLLKTAVPINDSELIYVSNMMYLKKANELLRDTTVRTQENHLVLMVIRSLSSLIGTDYVLERYCVKLTGKLFPHFDRQLYSSAFVSDSKIASATRIVSNIRDSFLRLLDKRVDENTKNTVKDKLRKLKFIWSNRQEIKEDFDAISRRFDENPTFLGFVKTGIRNLKISTYAYLHQNVNESLASFVERYFGDDHGVNALYYSNNVFIPPAAFHEIIFDPNVPPYVSYSGFGLIVGHELIHSVIEVEDLVKSTNFRNMEKCITNNFNKYIMKNFGASRKGSDMTKEDNVADFGGFILAYRAFSDWYNQTSKESKESRLPGLQALNEKQMFWVTAATNWCRKVSDIYVPSSIDKHAPPEYRIDGQFSNIPEFAEDFNCPENSSMNPKEKCYPF